MGCDIHMVLEQRHDGRWVGINDFPWIPSAALYLVSRSPAPAPSASALHGWHVRDRNYELFAQLAGVRGAGPSPRGLPDDASELAYLRAQRWRADTHSHSWGLLSEIGAAFLAASADPGAAVSAQRHQAVADLFGIAERATGADDDFLARYRLVYWFDN